MVRSIRSHVRQNVVGYLALISLALGGSTAYATVPGCGGPCVDSTDIINGEVKTVDIADLAVTTAKLGDISVTTSKLRNAAVRSNKILDGTILGADIAADTVDGGNIAANAVSSSELADGAVTTAKLLDDAVTSAKIGPGEVGNSDIADDAVTAAKIGAGEVGTSELADNAVTSAKILDGTVTADDLAAGAAGETAYRVIATRNGTTKFGGGDDTGDYWLPLAGQAFREGVNVKPEEDRGATGTFRFDPADYAVTGRTTKLRLRATLQTNSLAPGTTISVSLFPVTASGGSADNHQITLGTAVTGSTVTFTTPAANSRNEGSSGDFTAPVADYYVIGMTAGNAVDKSVVDVLGDLQVHNCSGC